ncbi:MAG: hypothetical protein P8J86_00870 [Phycisphaerales bacterium]|nr:hypothetical protein [Phycisphaerales bacterium]
MSDPVTVVIVNSLSYTGTTWLNLVLGSHSRTFTIGPPDRVYALLKQQTVEHPVNACRVHGPTCEFWQGFCEQYDSRENYFVQLADYAKCDVLVINNPIPNGTSLELEHPSIVVKPIQLIRDGRAVAASYRRKHPNESFFDGVKNWLSAPLNSFPFDKNDPDLLCLRYEDVLQNQHTAIEQIGQFVGVDYDAKALRFWEHPHHITAGNSGTIMMIKLAQELRVPANENREYYEEQLKTLQDNPSHTFNDKRWTSELSTRDRFAFDYFCGKANAQFGYDRDSFTTDEHREFTNELQQVIPPPATTAINTSPEQETFVAPPPEESEATPAPEFTLLPPPYEPAASPPLRQQLLPSYWLQNGIAITSTQARKLSFAITICLVVAILVIITLAILLGASSSIG